MHQELLFLDVCSETIEVDLRVPGIHDEIPFSQAKQCSPELDSPSCQCSSPLHQKLKRLQEKLIVTVQFEAGVGVDGVQLEDTMYVQKQNFSRKQHLVHCIHSSKLLLIQWSRQITPVFSNKILTWENSETTGWTVRYLQLFFFLSQEEEFCN